MTKIGEQAHQQTCAQTAGLVGQNGNRALQFFNRVTSRWLKGSTVVLSLVFYQTSVVWAQVKVESAINGGAAQVALGRNFDLVVTVLNDQSVDVSAPAQPQIDGARLISQGEFSNQASQLVPARGGMQFKTVVTKKFVFKMEPQRMGTLAVPAITVSVDGKDFQTKPFTVEVVAGQQMPRQQAPQTFPSDDEGDPTEQLFKQLLQRHGLVEPDLENFAGPPLGRGLKNPPSATNAKETFFIQVDVDKREVFEGEQILASWYIYTRGQILSLDRLKFPDLKGFWKEAIEEVPALNFATEVINGVTFRRALLATHALFPIKPGTSAIDEYKVKAKIHTGFGQAYAYTRSSERVSVNVKPLPIDNKPKDFSGAVGEFTVQVAIEGQKFLLNQPFSVKVKFQGTGNAKLIELPPMTLPAAVELYDTKSESKFSPDGTSFKQFELLMIPRSKGELKIPAMSFSFFNPKTKKYYSQQTQEFAVQIIEGQGGTSSSTTANGSTSTDVKAPQAPQLPALILNASAPGVFSESMQIWMTYFFGVLGLILLIWKWRRDLSEPSAKRKMIDYLRKKWKALEKIKGSDASQEAHRQAGEIINLYYWALGELGDISEKKSASKDLDQILAVLPPSFRNEFEASLKNNFRQMEILAFAGESARSQMLFQDNFRKLKKEAYHILEKVARF